MENNNNVQYYEIKSKSYDSKGFNYSLVDIQMENISEVIKDESIKDAIFLNEDEYKEKYAEEKQQLLYDLSLLENISETKQ
jgi:hypothetical protein